MSCRVVSCRVVSCRVVSCRVVSCRVVLCCVVFKIASQAKDEAVGHENKKSLSVGKSIERRNCT